MHRGVIVVLMESTDLTVRILQDIREDIHGLRAEQREDIHGLREEQREGRVEAQAAIGQFREESAERFAIIETGLRDMAEQLVMVQLEKSEAG